MTKKEIGFLLKNSLLEHFKITEEKESNIELEKDEEEDKSFEEMSKNEKKKVQTLTKKIKNATQGPNKLLKLSQVMDVAGVGDADNATDRSAIGKAVSGKKDNDGNVRHLTIKQANSMSKVVDNPGAFN